MSCKNKFVRHRPSDAKTEDATFFFAVVPSNQVKNGIWYYNRPIGKNLLGKMLHDAREILANNGAASKSKIANHSARKTSISTLLSENIQPLHVSQY